jgi:hypothetical protein
LGKMALQYKEQYFLPAHNAFLNVTMRLTPQ